MSTIQIIILTSMVNIILDGIIVGIVVYVIQKRIDASIQKSFVEYQTKFLTTHANQVETLKTLYKKLARYYDGFENLIRATSAMVALRREKNVTVEDYGKVEIILQDFRVFFIENRLFLPGDTAKKIESIYWRVKDIHDIARSGFAAGELETDLRGNMPIRWKLSDYRRYTEYSEEEWEGFDYADIMDMIMNDVSKQVETLEDFYKSVAELKN